MTYKVSIIVPVYNAEPYLEKCLDSLVGQTLQEIQIVIVNDGSTDASSEIIARYAAAYADKFTVKTKINEGQAIARNIALEMCQGEYIGFMDADDYACEDMFQKLYKNAKRQDLDLAMCDYYYVKESGTEVVKLKDAEKTRELLIDPKAAPWNKLYRREVIMQSGVRFREHLIYEDTAFYANLVPHILKFEILHEPLLFHVSRGGSTTRIVSGERYRQMLTIMDGILDYYRENNFLKNYYHEVEYFYSKILLGSSFQRLSTVENGLERNELLRKSLALVETNFPHFRKNPYYRGMLKLYVLCLRKWNVILVGKMIRKRIGFDAKRS